MKTIGLLGGMSWESTQEYYRIINEETQRLRGGHHSAPIAMISVDFHEIEELQRAGDWEAMADILSEKARQVETAGAELLLICTNTMHKVAEQVAMAVSIPLVHVADATAVSVKRSGASTVGLLGTAFTMEQEFYKGRLQQKGLDVLVPDAKDRELVHRVIYEELVMGEINAASRDIFLDIIGKLQHRGAEAVIEGCTEIGLLVKQEHTQVPLFDTAAIHAKQAVSEALTP
ncbi:MAG: aspartate/glutamate racemase family protein [Pseudomonadota bacterium]